jgi:hypothetical protein
VQDTMLTLFALLLALLLTQALPDEQRRDRAAAMALRIASMMGSSLDYGCDSSSSDSDNE